MNITALLKPAVFSGNKRTEVPGGSVKDQLFVRKGDYDNLLSVLSTMLPLIESVPKYADQAAATADGLVIGDVFVDESSNRLTSVTL